MITPRQFLTMAALCGAAVLAGSSSNRFVFGPFTTPDTATLITDRDAASSAISSASEPVTSNVSQETVTGSLGEATRPVEAVATRESPSIDALLLNTHPMLQPEAPMQLASLPPKVENDVTVSPPPSLEVTRECVAAETCIDEYLWSLYERAPKVDTNKVTEQIKQAIKKDGKIRNILKTITNYVIGDFTWKDPDAAQKVGMPLKDYVIGGMDPAFKLTLARALRKMDDAGFMPAITSAFRDDYRQSIANGNKAASDSSYHGGSRRGGYGHGLAADLVSVRGETRKDRLASSDELWKWIDANEKELGIGRPYRDRDPPHVGPLDGKEYVQKRAAAEAKKAAVKPKASKTATAETKKPAQPARHVSGTTKRASAEKPSKVSSLQTPAAAR